MLLRRAKSLQKASKTPEAARPEGYTNPDGTRRENAPDSWPFGRLSPRQVLALELQKLKAKKELAARVKDEDALY